MANYLVGAFIGIMIATIVGISVTIPVVQDAISNSSLTGTSATLAGYIPLLLVVVLIVAVVGLVSVR
jgi:hypothetical protein